MTGVLKSINKSLVLKKHHFLSVISSCMTLPACVHLWFLLLRASVAAVLPGIKE
jgi:hypothetical protein